jgi:hypothetical protein
MQRLVKAALWSAALLPALLVAAALLLPWFIDPNGYQEQLRAEVRQRSGLAIQIQQGLKLSLLPSPRLEALAVMVENPPGFDTRPLAEIARLALEFELWPLLHGELVVRTVELAGLDLNLQRRPDGIANWQLAATATSAPRGAEGTVGIPAIGGLRLHNGRLTLEDRVLGQELRLDAIELESGAFRPGQPMPIRLEFAPHWRLHAPGPEAGAALQGRIGLRGDARIDPVGGTIQVPGIQATFEGEGAALDGGHAKGALHGDLRVMLGHGLGVVTAELRKLHLSAELDRAGLRGKTELSGGLVFDRLDRALRLEEMRLQWEGQVNGHRLQGAWQGEGDATFDDAGGLVARLREFELTAELQQPGISLQGSLRGDAELDRVANRLVSGPLRLRFTAEGAALPGGPVQGEAQALLSATLDGAAFHLSRLNLATEGLLLDGEIKGYNLVTTPTFDGHLRFPEFDLRSLLQRHGVAPPDVAPPEALRRVKASLGFKAEKMNGVSNRMALRLAPLDLTVDDSRLSGNLTLRQGAIGFELAIDQIDLDRYLPPTPDLPSDAAPPPPATPGEPAESADALLGALRTLEIEGRLEIGQLRLRDLQAEQLAITLKGANGRWNLDHTPTPSQPGELPAAVSFDFTGPRPRVSVRQQEAMPELRQFLQGIIDR